jgi:uncharacterized protein (DUF983 family)
MGVWLYQQGDHVAHLYPDDQNECTAACGNELEAQCSHCGHGRDVEVALSMYRKCESCASDSDSGSESKSAAAESK